MEHKTEEVVLKSGGRGLLIDAPGSLVIDYVVEFRAGDKFVKTPLKWEVAHLMEHLAFGANEKYKNQQIFDAEWTKNGAQNNAYTSSYAVRYWSQCADFEWERILELMGLAITTPKFRNQDFETERENIRAELLGLGNDHWNLIGPRLATAMGIEIPSFTERAQRLKNIKLRDILEHYARTHTKENMRFIIVGDLKKKRRKIIDMLESWDLPKGERLEFPMNDIHATAPILIKRKTAKNLSFSFSFFVPWGISSEDLDNIDCLNYILNGSFHSRIFGKARERGWIYNMASDVDSSMHHSEWLFEGEVNYNKAKDLFHLIGQELDKIKKGHLTDEEVAAAKTYALGRYQMGVQTTRQLSEYYAPRYFLRDEIADYYHAIKNIDKINKDQILKVANEFFTANISGLGAVGKHGKIDLNKLWEEINETQR